MSGRQKDGALRAPARVLKECLKKDFPRLTQAQGLEGIWTSSIISIHTRASEELPVVC